MAIITCGSTWVARWGVEPQITTSSAMNKLTTPSHFFSTKIRALRSPSSSMFSQNSLRTLFNTRSSKSPCHRRGARLIVRAVSDFYSVLGVSKNARKSEIKSAYRNLARSYHPDVNK